MTATSSAVPPPRRIRPPSNRAWQKLRERVIEFGLLCCGLFSIVVTLLIAYVVIAGSADFFLYKDGAAGAGAHEAAQERMTVAEVWERVVEFFTGQEWAPGFANPRFGIMPLLLGTFVVTVIAAFVALPIGVATAIYLSEYAVPRVRAIAKPTLEILAGIPTVVYGFFAITALTPLLGRLFEGNVVAYHDTLTVVLRDWSLIPWFPGHLGDPTNQLAGGLVVGLMIIPMVASLSEDALRAVPQSLRDGAVALGANKFDTSVKVVFPAALSGVVASFLLALSRAIGETMAVTLACGDTPRYFLTFWSANLDPREGSATMTSYIVRVAQGDVPYGTTTFNSLFAVAAVLFFLTLFMNMIAQRVVRRFRQVYQ